ncbi:hypothetical protein [Nonomuraea basaltis]|uniref:hypothetical protein n=1 Tax=Nonomuraea basaltis TaxID=2495887 RepID=UPI0014868C5A|nr:hypothetical protein [Nonomuraea basaltis]
MSVFAKDLRARIDEVETGPGQGSDGHTVPGPTGRLENRPPRIAGRHGIEVA